ncbi:hypothetical protein SRHO_G00028740 [Serrasalmus rhombeus]
MICPVFTARPKATVTIHPADPVFIGETVTLTCDIGSRDGWYYEWFKDSKPLSEAGWRNKYTIYNVAASHRGVYTCKGRQSTEPRYSETSDAVTLTVSALPTATLTVEPRWSPVFTGESVTLKCEIQSHSNWRYQWYKGSSRTAVSQSQANTFTIRSAADQDQDQYWCRGERANRPTSTQDSNTVTLRVKERPRAVVSIQPDDQVFIGETVTLRCDIQGGGVSNWQYSWFKDDPSTPVSNEEQYRISSVTESHRGTYTCRGTVRGTSRYSHTSDAVTLTVSGKPKPTLKVDPQSSVYTGDTVTLICEVEFTGWEFLWFKDSQQFQPQSPADKNTKTVRVTVSDEGTAEFRCAARRGEHDDYPHYSDPVIITVKALPTATLTVEPRWSPVFTGESVTLKCEIQSHSNWRYQWYKVSSRTAVSQPQTNTFTIRSAADQDQDQYWCRGERDYKPSSSQPSNPVTLRVKERPRSVVSIQPDDQVFIGETVTLRCDIQGGGVSNWQYSWFKDDPNRPVGNEQQYRISSVTESHRGTYTCRGTVRGTSRYSHTSDAVTLTVSDLPKATLTSCRSNSDSAELLSESVSPSGTPTVLMFWRRDLESSSSHPASSALAFFFKSSTSACSADTSPESVLGLYHCPPLFGHSLRDLGFQRGGVRRLSRSDVLSRRASNGSRRRGCVLESWPYKQLRGAGIFGSFSGFWRLSDHQTSSRRNEAQRQTNQDE